MIKPEYGSIRSTKQKSAEVKVGAESVLPVGAEVKKPISLTATVFGTGTESRENSTAVKGKVTFTFVYLAEDGYKKAESAVDVSAEIPFTGADAALIAEDARAVATQDGYAARCTVKITGKTREEQDYNALCGGENVLTLDAEQTFDAWTPSARETFLISDEYELSYPVEEVLCQRAAAQMKTFSAGMGKITGEGEVSLFMSVLPLSGDGVEREKRVIPFRLELENPAVLPEMRVWGRVDVAKISVKVFTDEAKNKSTVNAEIALCFTGAGISDEKTVFASDAYSGTDETGLSFMKESFPVYLGMRERSDRITAAASGDIPVGGKLVACFGERATVYSVKRNGDKTTVDGAIDFEAAFKNGDNGVASGSFACPFSFDIDGEGDADIEKVSLCDFSAAVKNGAMELDCTLKTDYSVSIGREVSFIGEMSSLGERRMSGSAISVFIPKAGDGLWEISKELGASGEEITSTNPDLSFPLTGEERIIIYRQKT